MKYKKWFKGDIHTHTIFSDGQHTVEEAVDIAKDIGLEFIVLSDHNTFKQNDFISQFRLKNGTKGEANSGFTLIPGVELTTPKGHCNVIGIDHPFDLDEFTTFESVQKALHTGHSRGGFISINHPMIGDRWQWGFENLPFLAMEIWNGSTLSRNQEVLDWWQEQLCLGKKIIGTGGSDVHKHGVGNRFYGQGNTLVLANDNTEEDILEGLHRGHVCVSSHPNSSRTVFSIGGKLIGDTLEPKKFDNLSLMSYFEMNIEFVMNQDGLLKIIGDQGIVGELLIQKVIRSITYQVPINSKFYRLEMWNINEENEPCQPFFTNPIYINHH